LCEAAISRRRSRRLMDRGLLSSAVFKRFIARSGEPYLMNSSASSSAVSISPTGSLLASFIELGLEADFITHGFYAMKSVTAAVLIYCLTLSAHRNVHHRERFGSSG